MARAHQGLRIRRSGGLLRRHRNHTRRRWVGGLAATAAALAAAGLALGLRRNRAEVTDVSAYRGSG